MSEKDPDELCQEAQERMSQDPAQAIALYQAAIQQETDHLGGDLVLGCAIEKAVQKSPPLISAETGERKIVLHVHRQDEAGMTAIFRGQYDSRGDRLDDCPRRTP